MKSLQAFSFVILLTVPILSSTISGSLLAILHRDKWDIGIGVSLTAFGALLFYLGADAVSLIWPIIILYLVCSYRLTCSKHLLARIYGWITGGVVAFSVISLLLIIIVNQFT